MESCEIQFGDRHATMPVSANYRGNGDFETTGIDYESYSRMHTVVLKLQGARRIPKESTLWAFNDTKVRAVIIHMTELRAGFRNPRPGSDFERLAKAIRRMKRAYVPAMKKALATACREYALMKKSNASVTELKKLETRIKGMDTNVRICSDYPKTLVGIIYRYFRIGEDSTAIANALGLQPGNLRKIIHNVMATAVALGFAEPWTKPKEWGGRDHKRAWMPDYRKNVESSRRKVRARWLLAGATFFKANQNAPAPVGTYAEP